MDVLKKLVIIGFRRKFSQNKFRTKKELDSYIEVAKQTAAEVGLQVEADPWQRMTGKLYHLRWIIEGCDELDELAKW